MIALRQHSAPLLNVPSTYTPNRRNREKVFGITRTVLLCNKLSSTSNWVEIIYALTDRQHTHNKQTNKHGHPFYSQRFGTAIISRTSNCGRNKQKIVLNGPDDSTLTPSFRAKTNADTVFVRFMSFKKGW